MNVYSDFLTSRWKASKNSLVFNLKQDRAWLLFYQLVFPMYHKAKCLLFWYSHSLAKCTYKTDY